MGHFYTNLLLVNAPRQRIFEVLLSARRSAYVSPTLDGCTLVYDQETEKQDTRVLEELAAHMTRELKCTCLASLVFDSDIYMYWLYDNGQRIDAYNSSPDYFDQHASPTPIGGDAALLCASLQRPGAEPKVRQVFERVCQNDLNGPEPVAYLLGEGIQIALVEALGLPDLPHCTGFRYIYRAERRSASGHQFTRVPSPLAPVLKPEVWSN